MRNASYFEIFKAKVIVRFKYPILSMQLLILQGVPNVLKDNLWILSLSKHINIHSPGCSKLTENFALINVNLLSMHIVKSLSGEFLPV